MVSVPSVPRRSVSAWPSSPSSPSAETHSTLATVNAIQTASASPTALLSGGRRSPKSAPLGLPYRVANRSAPPTTVTSSTISAIPTPSSAAVLSPEPAATIARPASASATTAMNANPTVHGFHAAAPCANTGAGSSPDRC